MGILSGNPKDEPMHYGEVSAVWSYLHVAKAALVGNQVLINHSGDKDLKKFLQDYNENMVNEEITKLEELLKANGVGLPPAPPERPVANVEDIPVGARITDPEIASTISKGITEGLVACSTAMGIAIREDIGAIFGQFHMKKAQFGLVLLRMMKQKAWLVPPPLHNPRPRDTE